MAKKQRPAKGRSRGRGNRYDRVILGAIIIALIAIALTLWGPLSRFESGKEEKPGQHTKRPDTSARKEAARKKGTPEQPERTATETRNREKVHPASGTEKKALVAIVIDDLGQDLKQVREILSLPYAVTVAIMPGLVHSARAAELARQSSREIMLHLPMESRVRKGTAAPGTLRADMTPMDFLTTLSNNLASVPGAIGVNNHEGSALTENKEAMKFLMAELKARDLLFLDSLTTPNSVAYATAREFGLKTVRRDVFLDNNSENAASVRKQLETLAGVAREQGQAVGIGHPHPVTLAELRRWLTIASEQGIEIVPLSKIVN
jgi:polysaccharide deacetylase 2 family uncharacterized protein YibQ